MTWTMCENFIETQKIDSDGWTIICRYLTTTGKRVSLAELPPQRQPDWDKHID